MDMKDRKSQRMRQEIENLSFMSCKQRLMKIFAGIIGANRVTVSRRITELCEEKKLRNLNRRIQIHRDMVTKYEKENTIR